MTTRTPTQVASHAQKYFIRQLSGGKDKRRSSIHDITTVNLAENKSPPPLPEDNQPPSTDKSSLLTKPPQHSNTNGVSKDFYNYNASNQEGTVEFSLPNRSSVITSPHQRTYEQKLSDRNTYSISLHGFQLGDYKTVFQM